MIYLLIWGFFAILAAALARARGRSGCGWFLLGLLFGPFAWVVALLPSLKTPLIMMTAPPENCTLRSNLLSGPADFRCWHCAHLNQRQAWECEKCGQNLSPPLFG